MQATAAAIQCPGQDNAEWANKRGGDVGMGAPGGRGGAGDRQHLHRGTASTEWSCNSGTGEGGRGLGGRVAFMPQQATHVDDVCKETCLVSRESL